MAKQTLSELGFEEITPDKKDLGLIAKVKDTHECRSNHDAITTLFNYYNQNRTVRSVGFNANTGEYLVIGRRSEGDVQDYHEYSYN